MKELSTMYKHTTSQKKTALPRQTRFRLPLLLTLAALVLIILSIFITFTLRSQAAQTQNATSPVNTNQQQAQIIGGATTLPTQEPKQSSNSGVAAKPTSTPTHTIPVTPTTVPVTPIATPTLIPSTPQQTQYGVFPLSSGGPIPVPETVLHPTNIARVMLDSTLVSVYAGSMTRNPQVGVLCVLREDLTTGQLNVKMYQAPQASGALTVLAIQKNMLTITDSTKAIRRFNLNTNQFR